METVMVKHAVSTQIFYQGPCTFSQLASSSLSGSGLFERLEVLLQMILNGDLRVENGLFLIPEKKHGNR